MEDLTKNWSNLTLYEKEDTGFTLPRDKQLKEYIIVATFLISRYLVMEVVIRTLKHLWFVEIKEWFRYQKRGMDH